MSQARQRAQLLWNNPDVYKRQEEDGAVTVRDRDTMEQERIKIEDLKAYFEKKFEF